MTHELSKWQLSIMCERSIPFVLLSERRQWWCRIHSHIYHTSSVCLPFGSIVAKSIAFFISWSMSYWQLSLHKHIYPMFWTILMLKRVSVFAISASNTVRFTVYPKKYAHGFCFAVLCCGYTLTDFPISIRLTSLALWQSNDCPNASKATLMNMDKYFMWIHYERLHNHNKAKHNKTVCIFLGIYCITLAEKAMACCLFPQGVVGALM